MPIFKEEKQIPRDFPPTLNTQICFLVKSSHILLAYLLVFKPIEDDVMK